MTEERKKEYEFTVRVNTKYSSTEKNKKRASGSSYIYMHLREFHFGRKGR